MLDEAYERWWIDFMLDDTPNSYKERIAKVAWNTATKHTLAYVAEALINTIDVTGENGSDIADRVLRMKP